MKPVLLTTILQMRRLQYLIFSGMNMMNNNLPLITPILHNLPRRRLFTARKLAFSGDCFSRGLIFTTKNPPLVAEN